MLSVVLLCYPWSCYVIRGPVMLSVVLLCYPWSCYVIRGPVKRSSLYIMLNAT